MKIAKIDAAIAEAQRFIDRAKDLKAGKQSSYNSSTWTHKTLDGRNCPREQGHGQMAKARTKRRAGNAF